MPSLTRRRSADIHRKSWTIYYGDVRIGTIGERAGVPVNVDQWGWSCGFYPGLHQGSSAETFDMARAAFEEAWQKLLPKIPDGAFEEYRRDRARRAEIATARERGEKLPSELSSPMMRCVCGAKFDSHRPDESLPHRRHIYAAQAANGIRGTFAPRGEFASDALKRGKR